MIKSKYIAACISALVLLSSSSTVKSQALIMLLVGDDIASENFVGGVIGGLSASTLSQPASATYYVSWSFGALLQWRLSDQWVLSPEVTFKMPAGARGLQNEWNVAPTLDSMISEQKQWMEMSYVSIPVFFKYMVSSFGFFAGPQIGYLVAATDNASGIGPDGGAIDLEKSAFSKLNRWDVGVAAGVEFLLDPSLGIHAIRIGARYYQGLLDVTANDDVTATNSSILLTVGVPIGTAK